MNAHRRNADYLPPELDQQYQAQRRSLELEIQEAFLRFTASLMKGYVDYLTPIKSAPKEGTTDLSKLFNFDAFVRSRDRSGIEFYQKFVRTQMFEKLIGDRSGVPNSMMEQSHVHVQNSYYVFFDLCCEKVQIILPFT